MSRRELSPIAAAARHVVLSSTSLLILVPFIYMVSLSLKPPAEIFHASFSLLPAQWHAIENYSSALTSAPLLRFMANAVFVCGAILVIQLIACSTVAYALAKLTFPGQNAIFALVLFGLLIPQQVLALPLFILSYHFGILDTYAVLILPFSVSPFGIFLFRQFFKTIPDDIVHAARLDGMSEFTIIWKVILPMSLPAIVAFSIFSVVGHWNDLFWPLIAVRSQELMPPPLGLLAFKSEDTGINYGPLMAACTMIVAPLLLAFLFAQQWFVAGLATGGVK